MFALEIDFRDGISDPETIFVRRPHALVGASDYAHVVVEDMKELGYQIRLTRDLGRSFRCRLVSNEPVEAAAHLEGLYEGEALLDTGSVKLRITALDTDLVFKDGETPDSAGARILRQACAAGSPTFPALVVAGSFPLVISFSEEQPLYLGRSKQCVVRFDSSEISARHARMGFENGKFWIEDLGSTNGTFVNQQQVSGRVNVEPGAPVTLGREISIAGVTSPQELAQALHAEEPRIDRNAPLANRFPVLISTSEVARPARMVLSAGATVTIGRDPSSDMWIGAPHVSRKHCAVFLHDNGTLSVTDHSTNGTAYTGGVLKRGSSIQVRERPEILDLGSGVTVAVCLNEEQERVFIAAHGSPLAFGEPERDLPKRESPVIAHGTRFSGEDTIWNTQQMRAHMERSFVVWLLEYFRSCGFFGRAALFCLVFAFIMVLAFIVLILGRVFL
ncbi:MAG: FHA domain-containing protein [Oligoflexia bacterium]|nr:FHA domain-containing protein [Oligoflexia bacterium]